MGISRNSASGLPASASFHGLRSADSLTSSWNTDEVDVIWPLLHIQTF